MIARLARLYAALSHVNQAIVWTPDRDTLFRKICAALVEHGGMCMAWIGWHDARTQRITPIAVHGDDQDYVQRIALYADERPEGCGPTGMAFRSGQTAICNDVFADPSTLPWRAELARSRIAAYAAFPIRCGGAVCGVLQCYAAQRDFFRDKEIALLEEAATDVSFALDNFAREEARGEAERLAENERRFADTMIESLPGIAYFYDATGKFLRWNRNFELVSGYSGSEIAAMHPRDFFTKKEQPLLERRIAEVFALGESSVEAAFLAKNGATTEYFFTGKRVLLDDRPYLVGVGIDISQRKQAESALRDSEQRFRSTLDNILEGCQILGFDWRYLYLNHAAEVHNRRPNSDLLGRTMPEMWPGIEGTLAFALLKRCMDERVPVQDEIEFIFPDGSPGWFELRSQPVPEGIFVLSIDVSERKRSESALKLAQTLGRIAGRAARLGGWTLDVATLRLMWSDEICAIHEVPAGYHVTLQQAIDFYAPEYRVRIADAVESCMRAGTPYDVEMELITAKDRRIWVRAIGEPVRDADGRIVALQGAFQDISNVKQAEEERQRLALQLATTLDSISDGFLTLDRDWRLTYVNTAAERMVLRQRVELLGKTLWEAFPETVGTTFEREYRRAVAESVSVRFVEYFPPLERWFEVRAHPSSQGLAIYFLDVTGSRQAELALRASEERFRLLSKATSDVVWERDLVTGTCSWNDGVTRLFGYQQKDVDPTVAFFLNCVHADDVDVLQATVATALAQGQESWVCEYRFRRKDGSYVPILDSGYVIRNEAGQAVRMLGGMKDLTRQRHIEEALRLRDRAIQEVSQGILITDPKLPGNPIIYASAGVERITGYRMEDLIGKNCRMLQGKETDPDAAVKIREAIAEGRSCSVEILNYRKDGTPFWNALSLNPVRDSTGAVSFFVGVQNDITERKNLENQLRQAQKMEAIGLLAGGVAHDFNNLLTIISGYSELLLSLPDTSERVRGSITAISEAGERAAGLTRQLLGFSRQTILQPQIVDVNMVVLETGKMLRRLIGEDIIFTTVLDPNLSRVKVDPGQLDQILMNLAVNARDAMPHGGKLTVETANVVLSDDYASTHLDCKSGHHVLLAMTDTGCGMPPAVLARIFEPFFTTKEIGKGTGLGLAMVFGIVQQSNGCIHAYSEVGHGTTFKIYLPAVNESARPAEIAIPAHAITGTETILLVEDEEAVRNLALLSLRQQGYTVLVAADGAHAMQVARDCRGPIDLVLTDVVMPNISGPELVAAIKQISPQVKVLFMSGYTDDAVVRHGLLEADVSFIQKPYTPLSLARKVRKVLEGDG